MKKLIFTLFLLNFSLSAQAASNCTAESIAATAEKAYRIGADSNGKLFGTQVCTSATTARGFKCFNGCARVVSAILKKAGCGNSITNSAGTIWNWAKKKKKRGKKLFKVSSSQGKGCILGLNGSWGKSKIGALTVPGQKSRLVPFRHVAVAVDSWAYVDNESRRNKAKIAMNRSGGVLADIVMYESPLYLCPVE